ncbi:ADP-ribosylglycohydrolase [Lophiostoma macrostomum CBS 122681]|uniref:ADP-ribosylglycohydrolase n=1 Tax=Lophiostoma macrostomum CBS 122681 TaxID=1314788 RepID=A0A6A6TFS1_9PLEO|nr:ADP-ribosylglycohydrolase [Lophiostoma macrostomum CBS 122681]
MADFVHIDPLTMEGSDELPASTPQPTTANPSSGTKDDRSDLAFLDLHPFVRQSVLDKIYGCMIGSALGDTIGLYTEFLPKSACEKIYKEKRFSLVELVTECYADSHRNSFEPCAWTDDTDQALLILLSYLHSHSKPPSSITSPPSPSTPLSNLPQDFASRLQIWITQGLLALNRPPCGIGQLVGSVVSNPSYLSDPTATATTHWRKSHRHVAPNGSLMRTHPIALFCVGFPETAAWRVAADVGRTTHVDPRCVVSCCIVVCLIRGLVRGEITGEEDVDAAIERSYAWVCEQPELMNPGLDPELTRWEIERLLERKEFERHVYAEGLDELELESSREMGYVYKCLGSAVLTLRLGMRMVGVCGVQGKVGEVFERLITDLILQGGDADTNAAVAGALLGSLVGYARLPAHWSDGLAHKEWLMGKILRLTKAVGVVEGQVHEVEDEAANGGKTLMSKSELEDRDRGMLHKILSRDRERKEKEERRRNQGKGIGGWFKK